MIDKDQATPEGDDDLLDGYTKWMRESSVFPHSDDRRHPFKAFEAGHSFAKQPRIVTKDNAAAFLEEKLWEFIDAAGNFPGAKPDDRTWGHLLAYMPKHVPIPAFVFEERRSEATPEGVTLDDLAVSCGAASMVSAFTHPNGPRTAVKFKVGDGSLERFVAALYRAAPPQQVEK